MGESGAGKAKFRDELSELRVSRELGQEPLPFDTLEKVEGVECGQLLLVLVDHMRFASASRSLRSPRRILALIVQMGSLSFSAISRWVSPEKKASSSARCWSLGS